MISHIFKKNLLAVAMLSMSLPVNASQFTTNAETDLSSGIDSSARTAHLLTKSAQEAFEKLERKGCSIEDLKRSYGTLEASEGDIERLSQLTDFDTVCFLFDDSSSMTGNSTYLDLLTGQHKTATRWDEQLNRFELLMAAIAPIPVKKVRASFLNRKDVVEFNRTSMTSDSFLQSIIQGVRSAYEKKGPAGSTPLARECEKLFRDNIHTAYFILTDGDPDEGVDEIVRVIDNRQNKQQNPIMILPCTSVALPWVDAADACDFVGVADDYETEEASVQKAHGVGLRYTTASYVGANLLGAMNPFIDKLNDKGAKAFTKEIFDAYNGYISSEESYEFYLKNHPERQTVNAVVERYSNQIQQMFRPENQQRMIRLAQENALGGFNRVANYAATHPMQMLGLAAGAYCATSILNTATNVVSVVVNNPIPFTVLAVFGYAYYNNHKLNQPNQRVN